MRTPLISATVLAVIVTAGCSTHRRAPYADDATLLHYKPTLNDSATVIAERQWRHSPAKPPKPPTPVAKPADADEPASTPTAPSTSLSPPKAEPPGQLLAPPPESSSTVVQHDTDVPGGLLPVRPADAASATPNSTPVKITDDGIAIAPPAGTLPPPTSEGVQVAKAEQVSSAGATPPPPEMSPRLDHQIVPGNYGHDKDYHWVQGVLERHYRGYFCIRYCDPSEEDANGGKVRLIENAKLDQFQEGDIIGIEGEIVPNSTDSFHTNPRYLIRDIWLVKKK